jgi:1,4-alpha-glucan branching enzyme
MGGEFGQWSEWNNDQSLDWHLAQYGPHQGVQRWITDLNALYRSEAALYQVDFHHTGFEWIDFQDAKGSVIAFLRRPVDGRAFVIVVCNFTPVPRTGYRLGVPDAGLYRELMNSDSKYYAGGNIGNAGEVQSEPISAHGRPHSIMIVLPPLATVFLKRVPE